MPDNTDDLSSEPTTEDLVTRLNEEATQRSRETDALLRRIVEELKIAVARSEETLRRSRDPPK